MKNDHVSAIISWFKRYFGRSINRRLTILAVLLLVASIDILVTPKKRFLFSFYSAKSTTAMVETRFFNPGTTKEDRLQHYIEEYLLGPTMVDYLPLFPQDARVDTVLIRKDHAYINLSETAALPVPGSVPFEKREGLFAAMIMKNFQSIKEVSLFIAGNEVYRTNTDQKIKKSVDK
ncbi:MAG: GerMN domain-containing protein [Spirochaetota bacterium]|jgi:hypothetical protein|nr:GerMN domain-containing protein [Treponema sp.]